ncbi:MAG: sigma-70 family RNA polymerase sigma factor [Gammaproteobacteria bacterium]|nr:sigma-70 family RNA polymerase sigma factor [Gammaproteobacteria bacterium]
MTTSDPASWVVQHGNVLYRYALLRTQDAALAEDLVQETFLAALGARARFSGQSSEQTWLIGILKHKLIDHFRHQANARPEQEYVDDEAWLDRQFDATGHWAQPPAAWANPEGAIESQDFWRVFRGCIRNLPPHLADLFILREINDLTSQDVCKVLEISTTNNMWVMLSRARVRLRECLDRHWFNKAEVRDL